MVSPRQPLRDRCNVLLRVSTDCQPTSTKAKLPPNLISSAGNTPPVTSQKRLSRMLPAPPPPLPVLTPSALEAPCDDDGPRQFIPHLYLSSSTSPEALPTGAWTHVLRIVPASKAHRAGTSTITDATVGSPQILELYVGSNENKRALPLQKRHLLVARDFLALALPYYASANPVEDLLPSPRAGSDYASPHSLLWSPPPAPRFPTDPVRVLLVGPPRALLAISLTYIAYASECSVEHVMQCVVDEAEDHESCELLGADARMGLGDEDMKVLESLAKKGL
ncbi:hypothetical protein B0H16DRAFT_1535237 [Mycena metata]|uniref:Uncharacterized protein n=1 Tax=Mycena metata TaxID=1033252 RepID=A0AAD7NGA3_9AGAR|nr:hypothetical protein B0H16DRAFT_1535237 [Mycena metata]